MGRLCLRLRDKRWNWLYQGFNQLVVASLLLFMALALSQVAVFAGPFAPPGRVNNDVSVSYQTAFKLVPPILSLVVHWFGGMCFSFIGPKIMIATGMFVRALAYIIDGATAQGSQSSVAFLVSIMIYFANAWILTSATAIAMGYAPASSKGRYISVTNMARAAPDIVFYVVDLAMHESSTTLDRGYVYANSLYWSITVCFLVFFVASLVCVVNPNNVTRDDGYEVQMPAYLGMRAELKKTAKLFFQKLILFLFPILFWMSYETKIFLATTWLYLDYKAVWFLSVWWSITQIIGGCFAGFVVDCNLLESLTKKGWVAYGGVWIIGVLSFAFSFQGAYTLQVYNNEHGPHDLGNFQSSVFAWSAVSLSFQGFLTGYAYVITFWMLSAVAGSDSTLCAYYAGYANSLFGVGLLISGTVLAEGLRTSIFISALIFSIGIISLGIAVYDLRNVKLFQWQKNDHSSSTFQGLDPGCKDPLPESLEQVDFRALDMYS
uniref:Uncharacterized protein n=1 Tax=Mucochytrium quahogii TaxID=96639 RepID=A0A7S2S4I0_9STRA|mmetsp:Transcript_15317/g.24940  ORF Transcript_15317/g.24940 Transcript_15317/m.24940 type:complete len:490 (+) Transcript_15317:103-1572(+)